MNCLVDVGFVQMLHELLGRRRIVQMLHELLGRRRVVQMLHELLVSGCSDVT